MEKEKTCDQIINITKMAPKEERELELTKDQDWVGKLLMELNEKADDKSAEEYLKETNLNINLSLKKRFNPREGEMLLVSGTLTTEYVTQCIRTLAPMRDSLDIEINACFIDSSNQEKEMYKDQTETFQENQMFDLYFYEKKLIDLAAMLKEQVFLSYNQYPVLDPEAELIWAKQESEKKQ